jgi:O-antigen/teichoic acid export membrane protein
MKAVVNRYRRIAAETAWVFAGQMLSALGTLVGVRLVTEFVPPAVFGAVAVVVGVVILAHGVAAVPLMEAAMRLYPEYNSAAGAGVLRRAALRALRLPVAATSFALLSGLIIWTSAIQGSSWIAVMAGLLFIAEVVRSFEITFLNAARNQRTMVLLTVADAWARPIAAVAIVWLTDASSFSVVAGYLLGAVFALACLYVTRNSLDTPKVQASYTPEITRRLWVYAKPLAPLSLVFWISGQADRYMLAALAGLGQAGLYAAIYGLASRPFNMLRAGSELVVRPVYYAHVSSGNRRSERRTFWLWVTAVAGSASLLAFLIGLFHSQIAAILLAKEYREHSVLMIWIAVGYVFAVVNQIVERINYALHDTRGVAWVETAGAALSIAVALPMIHAFGLNGAAWSVPIYFGLQLLLAIARARTALAARERNAAEAQTPHFARSPHA